VKRIVPASAVARAVPAGALLACALVPAACRGPADTSRPHSRVRVAAAADLNVALGELIARFRATRDTDVAVSFGSSGTFYSQLLNRAPFDMFFSADLEYPRQLAVRGLTVPDSEFTYAIGRLVLWAPASSALDIEHLGLQALTRTPLGHLAIANPEHAPYGRAAIAALRSAGVYDVVRPALVYGENVAQALQLVQSGAADAGIVSLSLARAPGVKEKGRAFEIPEALYPRMEQGGTILSWAADLDAARAFRAFVLGPDGRAILQQHGFSLPDGE
jgi:molybdate transport system substrate-binding protein